MARIELGAQGYDQTCTLDGKPTVALSVYQRPGSNALETAELVRDKMEELKDRFPEGLDYAIVYDTTPFIGESVNEVFNTLRDAVILVAFVVLLFLQNWRSAIIPLVAVPVAIVGTFAVMAALGFSLNNLTLFGLVLAIGIVVDDAIVVVEAVEHHIEHGLAPRDATITAMDQVSGAGDRGRPGAHGGVRPVRVHLGDHRPVLPPVRPDDRHLDGDLGVQLADPEPGAGGPAAAAAAEGGVPGPAVAGVRGGRRLGWAMRCWARSCSRWPTGRAAPGIALALAELAARLIGLAAGGLAGWLVSGLLNRSLGWIFRLFNGLRRGHDGLHPDRSAACCGSACWCCCSTAACSA